MNLFLLRYGETNYNVLGLLNSVPTKKVHLTEKGILDAKKAAGLLSDEAIEKIFVSELWRTHQTASYINECHNAPIIYDARLNDISTGRENESADEFNAEKNSSDDVMTFKKDGGESSCDVLARAAAFLEDLKNEMAENVLIVSSEHLLLMMLSLLDHDDPRLWVKRTLPNGEVFRRVL